MLLYYTLIGTLEQKYRVDQAQFYSYQHMAAASCHMFILFT